MWDGIYANDNNYLVAIGNSTIKEMNNGVVMANNAGLAANASDFVDNRISFNVTNNISPFGTEITDNHFYTVNNLLPPANALINPYTGIELYNCSIAPNSSGIVLNKINRNTFTDMWNGIYINNTTSNPTFAIPNRIINLYDNVFSNIHGLNNTWGFFMVTNRNGWGIYVKNSSSNNSVLSNKFKVNVYANQPSIVNFSNCDKGVYLSRTTGKIIGNRMNNVVLGVFLTLCAGRNYEVSNNEMINVQLGICKNGTESSLGFKANFNNIALATIMSPQVFQNSSISTVPTGIISRYSSIISAGNSEIGGNNITIPLAINSIGISLATGSNDLLKDNQIHFSTFAGTTTNNIVPNRIGIFSNSNANVKLYSNIIDNDFLVNNSTNFLQGNNAGIYVINNKNCILRCNLANYMQYGIFAGGTNGSGTTYTNIIGNSLRGADADLMCYQFGTAGTLGLIGEIVSQSPLNVYNANNSFLGTPAINKVFRLNTTANACIGAIAEGIVTTTPQLNPTQSSEFNTFTNSSNINCPYHVTNPSTFTNSYTCSPNMSITGTSQTVIDYQLAMAIADEGINYDPNFEAGAQFIDEQQLYKWLDENPSYRINNTLLDSFFVANQSSFIGQLYDIEKRIDNLNDSTILTDSTQLMYNYNLAVIGTNALSTNDVFQSNAKHANQLYLKLLQTEIDSISSSDISFIENLAATCPYIGGNAVYRARAIVGDYLPSYHYDDIVICNTQGVYKNGTNNLTQQALALDEIRKQHALEENNLLVYPVPSSSTITVNYTLETSEQAQFILYDLMGNKINSFTVNGNDRQLTFDVSKYATGVYTYQFIRAGHKSLVGKIIVND